MSTVAATPATALVPLRTRGAQFVDDSGHVVRLRGVCLGGWLTLENFITGFASNESFMRSTVDAAIGSDRADTFFEQLLTSFFGAADARWLGSAGFNVVRIPVSSRHLQSDDRPLEIREAGFAHLDRAIATLATHGLYSIIDFHTVPGAQNHHWHSDNPAHVPMFWQHRQFQYRVVQLWQVIATRYRDEPAVAGYNLLNEPADESRAVVGPFYRRVVAALREIDPRRIHFLDGNTYSTEFDIFDDPAENTVYTLHDYVAGGLGRGRSYPGSVDGTYCDRDVVRKKFLDRSQYARATGTPLMVGEFGPIYTGSAAREEQRLTLVADQLALYRECGATWTLWTLKDVGKQGLVTVSPESAHLRRFHGFIAKKERLGADKWGTDGEGVATVTGPVQELVAQEFPNFQPYPWGRSDWVRTLLLKILFAQPLAGEYAELLRGLDDSELLRSPIRLPSTRAPSANHCLLDSRRHCESCRIARSEWSGQRGGTRVGRPRPGRDPGAN